MLPKLPVLAFVVTLLIAPGETLALSEIQREELAPPPQDELTLPDPSGDAASDSPTAAPGSVPEEDEEIAPGAAPDEEARPEEPEAERPDIVSDQPIPEIQYDLDALPEPVRRMRRLIVEACLSGDIEKLRPLIGTGESITQLSLGNLEGDPIDHLKEISGDAEGHEILAILLEIFQAGYVHMDPGTQFDLYVWPYFFGVPLETLGPKQRVELFTIVTAGDYADMERYGAYIFYRAGITPEGRWVFFVAGD